MSELTSLAHDIERHGLDTEAIKRYLTTYLPADRASLELKGGIIGEEEYIDSKTDIAIMERFLLKLRHESPNSGKLKKP